MRSVYWDAWKGAAIIAVVTIHACGSTAWFESGSFNSDFGVALRQLINFPVALFIFLSAYFSSKPRKDHHTYLSRVIPRLIRLLVPYAVWGAIYTALRLASGSMELSKLPWMMMDGTVVSVGYYVIVMVQMTLIAPFFERTRSSVLLALLFLSALTSCAFTYFVRYQFPQSIWAEFPINAIPFFLWLPFYFGGALAARHSAEIRKIPRSLLLSAYAAALAVSLVEAFSHGPDMRDLAISQLKASSILASGMVALIATAAFRSQVSVETTALSWLGQRSYYFYLSHMLVLGLVQKGMKLSPLLVEHQILFVPLSSILTVGICTIGALLFERIVPRDGAASRYIGLT